MPEDTLFGIERPLRFEVLFGFNSFKIVELADEGMSGTIVPVGTIFWICGDIVGSNGDKAERVFNENCDMNGF